MIDNVIQKLFWRRLRAAEEERLRTGRVSLRSRAVVLSVFAIAVVAWGASVWFLVRHLVAK